jgi:hypothetical protein
LAEGEFKMILRRFLLAALSAVLIALVSSSVAGQADTELPAWADLEAGAWTQIDPGGNTICSNGTPYAFFARPAAESSNKLLIHFQGGGACWFGEICDLTRSPTYDPFVDDSDNPGANPAGIFDFENEENPFSDYNMVMVPYCTADVHIGSRVSTYPVEAKDDLPAGEVTIHHNGYVNATTVLDWTFENVQEPETVFVTGCSAGSIPSPFYTQFVAQAYPDARIEQLGDASGGYRIPDGSLMTLRNWGTMGILPVEYADFSLRAMNFEHFYMTSAALFPNISFTQFNAANDQVQQSFLGLTGVDAAVADTLEANLADIEASVPDNFANFTVGGDSHCVTMTPDFYTFGANGERIVDWVAALAAGEDVTDVVCEDCTAVETITGG